MNVSNFNSLPHLQTPAQAAVFIYLQCYEGQFCSIGRLCDRWDMCIEDVDNALMYLVSVGLAETSGDCARWTPNPAHTGKILEGVEVQS